MLVITGWLERGIFSAINGERERQKKPAIQVPVKWVMQFGRSTLLPIAVGMTMGVRHPVGPLSDCHFGVVPARSRASRWPVGVREFARGVLNLRRGTSNTQVPPLRKKDSLQGPVWHH